MGIQSRSRGRHGSEGSANNSGCKRSGVIWSPSPHDQVGKCGTPAAKSPGCPALHDPETQQAVLLFAGAHRIPRDQVEGGALAAKSPRAADAVQVRLKGGRLQWTKKPRQSESSSGFRHAWRGAGSSQRRASAQQVEGCTGSQIAWASWNPT